MELFTLAEVAEVLKISKLAAWQHVRKGNLKSYRVGRQHRVFPQDLQAFIRGEEAAE
ncbi:helix-turn-helix domain-containing protein [Metabacillus fastidiosus]|uniref:helix-turn-helix domain-containing protein n=1 Tax=Metabacillus fastidiosus TaxID=1458 RepID=UPI0009EF1924|nr:helix-turn-helix domain-containing protein [Metabacillus fastidiosus]MED4464745.1 helix-turn-helix domain-containing protein [Metabacillus fastidiosus]